MLSCVKKIFCWKSCLSLFFLNALYNIIKLTGPLLLNDIQLWSIVLLDCESPEIECVLLRFTYVGFETLDIKILWIYIKVKGLYLKVVKSIEIILMWECPIMITRCTCASIYAKSSFFIFFLVLVFYHQWFHHDESPWIYWLIILTNA